VKSIVYRNNTDLDFVQLANFEYHLSFAHSVSFTYALMITIPRKQDHESSDSIQTLGDFLIAIENDYILRRGKRAYFAAIRRIADKKDITLVFCHPSPQRRRASVDLSEERK
jgi:hypothetical protein